MAPPRITRWPRTRRDDGGMGMRRSGEADIASAPGVFPRFFLVHGMFYGEAEIMVEVPLLLRCLCGRNGASLWRSLAMARPAAWCRGAGVPERGVLSTSVGLKKAHFSSRFQRRSVACQLVLARLATPVLPGAGVREEVGVRRVWDELAGGSCWAGGGGGRCRRRGRD